jgi:hypothetical protein
LGSEGLMALLPGCAVRTSVQPCRCYGGGVYSKGLAGLGLLVGRFLPRPNAPAIKKGGTLLWSLQTWPIPLALFWGRLRSSLFLSSSVGSIGCGSWALRPMTSAHINGRMHRPRFLPGPRGAFFSSTSFVLSFKLFLKGKKKMLQT